MVRRTVSSTWLTAFLALAFAIAVSLVLFQAVSRSGRSVPYSSTGAGPTGIKAVRLLLESRGHPVNLIDRPFSEMSDAGGLIFVIEPARPVTTADRAAALAMVRRGATFVVAGTAIGPFAETVADEIRDAAFQDAYLMPQVAGPFLSGVPGVLITSGFRLTGRAGGFVQYFGDDSGGVVREYSIGKGRIIMVADPEAFTNRVVHTEPANALLALGLARAYSRNGPVAFAEYYHGLGGERGRHEPGLVPDYLEYAFRQLVIVILLALAVAAWRFGRPIPMPAGSRRSIGEYIRSVGNLYRRAGAHEAALEGLYRNLLRVMRDYCGFEYDVAPGVLAKECARRRGSDAAELERLMERCSSAISGRQELSEKALFSLARQIDRCRKEFERNGVGK